MNFECLARIVFSPDYPGHRPAVREVPNGDGKVDAEKRYAHVANKYLREYPASADHDYLQDVFQRAWFLSYRVAVALDVPRWYLPDKRYSALRVLEYPVGATSNLHTDFDLFTCMIYRDQPDRFVAHDHSVVASDADLERELRLLDARKVNPQLHIGEIGELVGLGPATPHEVIASDKPQRSVVFFAIPDHAARLPSGQTVGDWIAERMARSRVEVA